jgi:hypothetical protein
MNTPKKSIINPVVNFIMPDNGRPMVECVEEVTGAVKDFTPRDRQMAFLSSSVDIAIWAPGLRGCGKTWALLLEAARHVQNKNYRAVCFRRVYGQLVCPGGLIDASQQMYPWLGGKLKNSTWTFPSGTEIVMDSLHYETDVQKWIGSSLPVICFDQFEEFSKTEFLSMLETNHGQDGSKGRIRAAASFNFRHDNWLLDFLSWWTMGSNQPLADRLGKIRWMAVVSGKIVWANSESELRNKYAGVTPRSVTLLA